MFKALYAFVDLQIDCRTALFLALVIRCFSEMCLLFRYDIMTHCWEWHGYSRPTFNEIVKQIDDVLMVRIFSSNTRSCNDAYFGKK